MRNAEAEYQRYQQLYDNGAISLSTFESKGLALETAQKKRNEAKAVLKRIHATQKKNLMQKLAKEQSCTIVLVTHDNRILDIADRIINMEDASLAATS